MSSYVLHDSLQVFATNPASRAKWNKIKIYANFEDIN